MDTNIKIMQVDKIIPVRSKHGGCYDLKVYIFKQVFDYNFFQTLSNLIDNIFQKQLTDTFLTHNTIFKFESIKKRILSHKQNNRKQHVLWDMVSHPDYYYNTQESIKDWSDTILKKANSLVFYKLVKYFESVEPLFFEAEKWIPLRSHINVLNYDQHFTMHRDGDPIWFNKNLREARLWSCTIYLDSISLGGELWTDTGLVYKPERNSALMLNGNQVYHGVNNNMDPRKIPRKAFTIRWAHIDDLFLPGHPSKTLYKVDYVE